MIYLDYGTGIGAGVIVDGKLTTVTTAVWGK